MPSFIIRSTLQGLLREVIAASGPRRPMLSATPPSVITNGRPLALASKFLPRRLIVRFMGRMARRQRTQLPVALTNSQRTAS